MNMLYENLDRNLYGYEKDHTSMRSISMWCIYMWMKDLNPCMTVTDLYLTLYVKDMFKDGKMCYRIVNNSLWWS